MMDLKFRLCNDGGGGCEDVSKLLFEDDNGREDKLLSFEGTKPAQDIGLRRLWYMDGRITHGEGVFEIYLCGDGKDGNEHFTRDQDNGKWAICDAKVDVFGGT